MILLFGHELFPFESHSQWTLYQRAYSSAVDSYPLAFDPDRVAYFEPIDVF